MDEEKKPELTAPHRISESVEALSKQAIRMAADLKAAKDAASKIQGAANTGSGNKEGQQREEVNLKRERIDDEP